MANNINNSLSTSSLDKQGLHELAIAIETYATSHILYDITSLTTNINSTNFTIVKKE